MRNVIPAYATMVPKQASLVFKGAIYDTYQWQQKLYDGSTKTFEMLKRPDTVVVIAIKDNKIIVLEQEQPSHQPFYDVPGGMHDHDEESELDAVKRELLEETGMKFEKWKLLDVSQRHNKIEQFVYVFLATDFKSQIEPKPDAGEKIEIKLLSLEETKALALTPKGRFIPKEILNEVDTLEDLLKLPEYIGSTSTG